MLHRHVLAPAFRPRPALAARAVLCACASLALAQAKPQTAEPTPPSCSAPAQGDAASTPSAHPVWLDRLAKAESQRLEEQRAALVKDSAQIEKELRKLRVKHFGDVRKESIRQEGLLKLRGYNTPAAFPALVEVFRREKTDVRTAVLDMIASHKTPEAASSLAWLAVFDNEPAMRAQALGSVRATRDLTVPTPDALRLVVYEGLKSNDRVEKVRAVEVADALSIVEVIPWIIASQLQLGQTGGGNTGGGSRGDLAWIFVGQQVAYVQDLTPIVSEGAVAFDPQVGVVNEGVVVRVLDAAVATYHVDLHNALVRMTSRLQGSSTEELGWDQRAWATWYKDEFMPSWNAKREATRAGGG